MVFSSLVFLCIFLPVAVALYFCMPSLRAKNVVLTIFSLIFYAWGEPVWVLLLIGCALCGFWSGLVIGKYRGRAPARVALIISLVINLGVLAFFKYINFFVFYGL